MSEDAEIKTGDGDEIVFALWADGSHAALFAFQKSRQVLSRINLTRAEARHLATEILRLTEEDPT